MKKFSVIIIAIILLITMTSCKNKKEEDLKDNNITMIIKEGTLTKTSATIIISDTGKNKYVYGEPFKIEKYEDNTWVEMEPINDNYGFNMMAYYTNENNELELKHDWSYMYGKLEKGKYKLIKDTFLVSDEPVTENDKIYFSVEFNIE